MIAFIFSSVQLLEYLDMEGALHSRLYHSPKTSERKLISVYFILFCVRIHKGKGSYLESVSSDACGI
jgi:hypothetical protein